MRRFTTMCVTCILLLTPAVLLIAAPIATESFDAVALIKKIETQYQGKSSTATMKMIIKTNNWNRTLVMDSLTEGRDKFLIKITSPAKERGTCTLKVDDNIWNYLPKIDRLIKVPSSLMGEKWMGSHFTNDDLVKENKIDDLYTLKIIECTPDKIVIEGIPKQEAAVVWGKLLYTVDRKREIPQMVEYFDEENIKVRTLSFDQAEKLDSRWIPMRMRVIPEDTPEEYTEMLYSALKFNIKLPRNTFSIRSLRKR